MFNFFAYKNAIKCLSSSAQTNMIKTLAENKSTHPFYILQLNLIIILQFSSFAK